MTYRLRPPDPVGSWNSRLRAQGLTQGRGVAHRTPSQAVGVPTLSMESFGRGGGPGWTGGGSPSAAAQRQWVPGLADMWGQLSGS